MKGAPPRGGDRVRRSPHLVCYWRRDQLIVRNYATGAAAVLQPIVYQLLNACSEWTTVARIGRELAVPRTALLRPLVRQLIARSFLHRKADPLDPRERAMSALAAWNPEAGFFHTATKNVRFWSPQEAARRARQRALELPMPAPVKRYPGVPAIDLPPPDNDGEFARVARARRTWRRFSPDVVRIDELATLLGLSAGVQQWVTVGAKKVPLKTSPSGGARHPIECYVVVRKVKGLASGIYHYAADRHALTRLSGRTSAERIKQYLPHSGYFAGGSAVVFFTAMFERQLWRYPYSRAYRAALIEAGHVCQTFCLAATSLGLAPFSVMGLADSVIERDLGIDGITETVLYAAGVGRPPARSSWASRRRGTLKARANRRLG